MNWLGTDANSIVIAFEWNVFTGAAHAQFTIRPKLLCPISRDAAANGQDAEFFLLQECFSKVVEIVEWVITKLWFAIPGAHAIVERHIQAHL